MKSKNALIALGGVLAAAFLTKKLGKGRKSKPVMRRASIQAMVNQYREKQLVAVKNGLGFDDTQSIWFDLKKLKRFIEEVEKETSKAGYSSSEVGIRFYNGAYPENLAELFPDDNIPKDYALRHTLIMIPTVKRKGEYGDLDYDFNPYETTEDNTNEPQMRVMSLKSAPAESMGENHGNMIPPEKPEAQSY